MKETAVFIIFDDPATDGDRVWRSRADIREADDLKCWAVQFLIREDEKYLTLAPTVSEDGDQVAGAWTLPKGAILFRKDYPVTNRGIGRARK